MATSKGTPASAASGSIGVRQTLQKRALKLKMSDKSMAGMAVDPAVEDAEVSSFGMTSAMIGAVAAPVQASGFSPDLNKRREAVEELFGRIPAQPTALAPPPPFPTRSSGSSDVHSALMELVSSVNEVRSSLANMATRSELQELHILQMEEVKTDVASQLEPIKRNMMSVDGVRQEIAASEVRARQYIDKKMKAMTPSDAAD